MIPAQPGLFKLSDSLLILLPHFPEQIYLIGRSEK